MLAALAMALATLPAGAASNDLALAVTLEARAFAQSPLTQAQDDDRLQFSGFAEAEYSLESADRRHGLSFAGFYRHDETDPERSHGDLRDLFYRYDGRDLVWHLGWRRVFWGKTEAVHLVDIINQTDGVENIDGEDKLGQPMANLSWVTDAGTLDAFLLPYFRERRFPGAAGRLRPFLPVDSDHAVYESAERRRHLDAALRYSGSVGDWDFGLSYFRGTAREPRLLFAYDGAQLVPGSLNDCLDNLLGPLPDLLATACGLIGVQPRNPRLLPAYDQIRQVGLDLQYLLEGWFFKLEAVHVHSAAQRYDAAATGFEYTWGAVWESPVDVSLIAEYLYDSRGLLSADSQQALATRKLARGEAFTIPEALALANLQLAMFSPFQNDVFLGTRLGFNDVQSTEAIAGVVVDLDTQALIGIVEASLRLGESWKLSLEARAFGDVPVRDMVYSVSRDDLLQLQLTRYF